MKYVFLILIGLVFACESVKPEKIVSVDYVKLDSILDEQIQKLANESISFDKEVVIDNNKELQVIQLDTSGWRDEFSIIRDLDLNVPNYVGAFDIQEGDNFIQYYRSDGQDVPIEYVEYQFREDGSLKSIKGSFMDDKARLIYSVYREYELNFDSGLLQAYRITGFQKMMLKDTTRFEVKATIN